MIIAGEIKIILLNPHKNKEKYPLLLKSYKIPKFKNPLRTENKLICSKGRKGTNCS